MSLLAPISMAVVAASGNAGPIADQTAEDAESEGRTVIDILAPPPGSSPDPVLDEVCAARQDAATISGEIVVCGARRDDAHVSGYDPLAAERRHAERTKGSMGADVEGSGGHLIYRAEGSVLMVGVKATMGRPREPAELIDVEALPEAPAGSDAARVGDDRDPEP